jgi:uncharacterized membrane protein YfbV (UPF0208 family)
MDDEGNAACPDWTGGAGDISPIQTYQLPLQFCVFFWCIAVIKAVVKAIIKAVVKAVTLERKLTWKKLLFLGGARKTRLDSQYLSWLVDIHAP